MHFIHSNRLHHAAVLPFSAENGIFRPHLQNQVPGLEPCEMLQATYDALASFICRALSYTSMVGWTGAP